MKSLALMLVAAMTLALWFAAPAQAGPTEWQKCAMKADMLVGKFGLCLSRADANVSKGKATDTTAADAKCVMKFSKGWTKVRDKAQEKDPSLGANCGGKMHDSTRDSGQASTLVAYGRSLNDYAELNPGDLSFFTMNSSVISAIASENCVAGGGAYNFVCGIGKADNEEPTSDCCTAPSTYDCYLGSYCAQMAFRYHPDGSPSPDRPSGGWSYENIYEGHTSNTGEALAGGCNGGTGAILWVMGQSSFVDVNQKVALCGTP